MSAAVWAALALLATAGAVDLLLGRRWDGRPLPYLLGAAASALLAVVGAAGVAGDGPSVSLDEFLAAGPTRLTVDRLSGLFLLVSFAVAVPVSLVCASWARQTGRVRSRGLGAAYALTLGSVAVVLTAEQAFTFLFAWETLTLAFYLLAGFDRHLRGRADASITTIVLSRVSGSFLLVGFLLLAARSGSLQFASYLALPPSGLRDAAYALLLAGFAVKVGLIPVHVWMPVGYGAAPGPLRAVMAAVAVNVGFYGMWRTLDLLGSPPGWLAAVLLVLAGMTALLGIAHAVVQTDLRHVVAYSSVENGGLITVGFAIALIGSGSGEPSLVAVGLLAGTLQMIAHGLAKAVLFCTTAAVEDATGTTRLDDLRGVGHRLPWTGAALAVGAITLAGLPLTVGFVSEWFLLESLMQQFRIGGLAYTLPMAAAGALVALTAGFAAVAFVRIVGLVVLGPRGPEEVRPGREAGPLARVASGALALSCLAIAALSPLEIRVVAAGLDPVVPRAAVAGALKSAWVLQPVYAEFSILSPSWLWIMMPALFALTAVGALVLSGRRLFAVRRVPAWRSATGGVEGESQYTPFGFANPTRKVLATVLMTRSELVAVERETGGRVHDLHRDVGAAELGYTSDVMEIVERLVYRPLARPLAAAVQAAKRLQSGRLDAYVAYMLIALVAALALVLVVT